MPLFEIIHKDNKTRARTGVIHTDHGDIATPIFMPVGTQGAVKSVDSDDLKNIGAQIILGNTYHLHLRPGEDLINSFGGLHKFMNWKLPILTDSGGFQVFSLRQKNKKTRKAGKESIRHCEDPDVTSGDEAIPLLKSKDDDNSNQGKLVEIDEDGVTFRSYIDGSTHRFTPEIAIEIQHKIGADIIMAFDECTPDEIDEKYVREAMDRTHRWAERSLKAHQQCNNETIKPYNQFLFGIIQGSNYKHLREESAKIISSMDFDGIAVGGESVGYNMEATKKILDWIYPHIPENKPHYAMGVGYSPQDLFEVVEAGIDMFDCVAPTRIARNGAFFIHPNCHSEEQRDEESLKKVRQCEIPRSARNDKKEKFIININNAQFKNDQNPIDRECQCYTCIRHTRAYLHHLFKAQELLAYRLATIHNLHFFLNLMKEIRKAINEDGFLELKKKWV